MHQNKNILTRLWVATLIGCGVASAMGSPQVGAVEVRIKDITTVQEVRSNHLEGVGLVVGLNGTGGDGPVTRNLFLNYLQRSKLRSDPIDRLNIAQNTQLKTENVGAVTVSAQLPIFARKGSVISVNVAAMDAESLEGGILIRTALRGYDGKIYAIAKGPVVLGGFSAKGQASSVRNNHPTRGHVVDGATIEAEVPYKLGQGGSIGLLLREKDFETARRIADAINKVYPGAAHADDDTRVDLIVPLRYRLNPVAFLGDVQMLRVVPDTRARVVIDDKTGTIVIGRHVKVSSAVINHGNLTVVTAESPQVSQPRPFANGSTVVTPKTDLSVTQEKRPLAFNEELTTLEDIASAMNALGVAPRDLSTILHKLYEAGAIHGEVEFK